jgi:ribosomal protein S18 acetylase RimI-like enzyme
MDVSLRFGEATDAAIIADYALKAGGGLFEFLLDGVLPFVTADSLLRIAVVSADSALHYSNSVLAELESRPVGMLLCYAARYYGIPSILEGLVPRARLDQVREILSSRIENSFYVNTLIVQDVVKGRGVGRLLLNFAASLAQEQGHKALSLHAWADNVPAVNLYRESGFAVAREIALPPTTVIGTGSTVMLLMKADLPLNATAQDRRSHGR